MTSSFSESYKKRFPSVEGEISVRSTICTIADNVVCEKWPGTSSVISEETDSENKKKLKSSKEYKGKEVRLSYIETIFQDRDHLDKTEGDKTEIESDNESEIIEEEVEEEIEVEEEEEEQEEDVEEGVGEEYDEGEEKETEKILTDDENVPENVEAPVKVDDETEEHERQLKIDKQFKLKEEDDEKGQLTDQEEHVIVNVPADTAETLPADTAETLSADTAETMPEGEARKESTSSKSMPKKKIIKIKKIVKRKKVSRPKEEAPMTEYQPTHFSSKEHIELKNEKPSEEVVNKEVLLQEEEKIDFEKQKIIAEHEKLLETMRSKLTELMRARKKNRMLHKSMIDYYKKKKMEYVYEGETPSTETVRRYIKKVKVLEEMTIATEFERQKRTREINELKSKLQECENGYKRELAAFLQWETEVGKSVIESNTGTGTDENIVELLVQRHEVVLNQLSSARLRLIKLEKQLSFKENALKNLVCLEGNLSLIDYEQLRMENHNFSEKIEERDEELSNLRNKMLSVIHTYSHVREKASSIIDEIDKSQMHIRYVNKKVNALREQVNKLKQYRDGLRCETTKLKKSAGLVLQPRLVIDYEDSLDKFTEISAKLESSENEFNQRRSKILRLRDLIQTITTLHETTGFNKSKL